MSGFAASNGLGMGLGPSIFMGAGLTLLAGFLFYVFWGRPQAAVEKARALYICRCLNKAGIPYSNSVCYSYTARFVWRQWRRLRRALGPVAGAAAWSTLAPSGSDLFVRACDVVEDAMEGSRFLTIPNDELAALMTALAPAVSDLGVPDGKALCALVDKAVEQHSVHNFSGLLKSGDVISNIRALNAGVAPEYVLAL